MKQISQYLCTSSDELKQQGAHGPMHTPGGMQRWWRWGMQWWWWNDKNGKEDDMTHDAWRPWRSQVCHNDDPGCWNMTRGEGTTNDIRDMRSMMTEWRCKRGGWWWVGYAATLWHVSSGTASVARGAKGEHRREEDAQTPPTPPYMLKVSQPHQSLVAKEKVIYDHTKVWWQKRRWYIYIYTLCTRA